MTLMLHLTSTHGTNSSGTVHAGVTVDDITNVTEGGNPVLKNASIPDGCREFQVDKLGYLPWNNSNNMVSLEDLFIAQQVQQNVLFFLFLIGGPANVLNMAVFHKQGLRDRVNLCLFALSLADLLYLVAAMFLNGQQMVTQFSSREGFGPALSFVYNNNLLGFYGFQWVAQVLTAVVASERCLCVLSPLKFQTLFSTRTMAIIIVVVYVVIVGLFFFVSIRYRVACVFDPVSGTALRTFVSGELYDTYKGVITYLDAVVFGGGLPAAVTVVVVTTTIITTVKLRQVMKWRTETSSSALSVSEVALTKMLVANSVLFIVCVVPDAVFRVSWGFLPDMSAGGRHQNFYYSCHWTLDIITYINSSFNFFVFYTMGSRYRETFWALLGRKPHTDRK